MHPKTLTGFILTLVMLTLPAYADQVIGVTDGDTLTVLHDQRPLKIRLANIDAPEKKQAFGERSKQSLSELCYGQDASYAILTLDRYGRTVALVTCAGVDVNRAQVERGMAWVYTRYNQDETLPRAEATAKEAQRGLWSEKQPIPPWEFRRAAKARVKFSEEQEFAH